MIQKQSEGKARNSIPSVCGAPTEKTRKQTNRYIPKPPPKTRGFKKWTLRDLDEDFK